MIRTVIFILALMPPILACNTGGEGKYLFNGNDLTGWHMDVPAMDSNPDTTVPFLVRDGMLVSLGIPGGHLITDEIYKNYRLEVEYRFCRSTRKLRSTCTCINTKGPVQHVSKVAGSSDGTSKCRRFLVYC